MKTGVLGFVFVMLCSSVLAEMAETKAVPSDGIRSPWLTTDLYWRGSRQVADVKTIGVTYTWELRKEETVQVKGKPHTWYACFLTDHDRKAEHRIGALRFEGETFAFNGNSTSFVEIYATSKIRQSQVSVVFQSPKVNGETLLPKSVGVFHPRKGEKRGTPSPVIGRAVAVEGGIQVDLFNEVLTGEAVPPTRYDLKSGK